jgi:hypothetical protein
MKTIPAAAVLHERKVYRTEEQLSDRCNAGQKENTKTLF